MPSREFASRDPEPDPDPIRFVLSDVAAGRDFRCTRMIPPAAVEQLAALPPIPDAGADRSAIMALHIASHMAFIRTALVPEDRDDWDALTISQPIAPECYAEIVGWLCNTYAERLSAAAANVSRETAELDPLARRQAELNIDAHGEAGFDLPGDLPPNLQAILDAGGGFSKP